MDFTKAIWYKTGGSEASEEFGNVLVVAVVFFAVRVEVPPLLPALVGVTDTVDQWTLQRQYGIKQN